MGWASGSELADRLWTAIRPHISAKNRRWVARRFIQGFDESDCDTLCECEQLVEDAGKRWFAKHEGSDDE